jgi:ParB-like chromosome segregation protein Spo0J
MNIEYVEIEKLKASTYNPRQITGKQKKDLLNSLIRFGFVEAIVVNKKKGRENIVIGGHQRLLLAAELHMKRVPVVYVELELAKERELNIRLNKNVGAWDFDTLANEFDIEELRAFGFTDKDLHLDTNKEKEKKEKTCPACGYSF